ncbi:MAG: cupin domain-containing protein [Treponema sp.]|nr:cupin domain-containing protein [Treponema sp.]
MEIVHDSNVPANKVEDRVLQWAVGPKGTLSSDCCSSCIVKYAKGASGRPPHSHRDCEELIYILAGSGEVAGKGGVSRSFAAGDFVLFRKEEIHMLKNTGPGVLQALCFYSAPTDNSKYDFYDMETVEKPHDKEPK